MKALCRGSIIYMESARLCVAMTFHALWIGKYGLGGTNVRKYDIAASVCTSPLYARCTRAMEFLIKIYQCRIFFFSCLNPEA